MTKLTPIHQFKKTGFWLAVVLKGKSMYVAASSKEPNVALKNAHQAGYKDAALMRSAKSYGAFTSIADTS